MISAIENINKFYILVETNFFLFLQWFADSYCFRWVIVIVLELNFIKIILSNPHSV